MGEFILPPDWQIHDYSPRQFGKFIQEAMDFFQASERRGLKPGTLLAWPYDEATWHSEGTAARQAISGRGQRPTDGLIAVEMGIPKPTFDRRKRDWGIARRAPMKGA